MSTGSTSASSSTLTSSSGGAGAVHNGQYHLPETFVDEHGFQRNLSDHHHSRNTGNAVTKTLIRSTSSVTDHRPKSRPPIAKPVRRSKSQHISAYKGGSFVTSIQHGGSVTSISLGGDNSASGNSRADQVKKLVRDTRTIS
jgi:hypothetical protein